MALGQGQTATCGYCSAHTPVPPEYRQLQQANRSFAADRELAHQLYGDVGKPPGRFLQTWGRGAEGTARIGGLVAGALLGITLSHPLIGPALFMAAAYGLGFPVAAGIRGVNVSLDHSTPSRHNELRQNPNAFEHACNAVSSARELGLYVSVVCCVTRESLASGDVFRVVDLAEQLGAHSIQLNEIRPVGRALDANDPTLYLTEGDKKVLVDYYQEQNASDRPIAIVLPWYNETPHRFGCTATSGQKAYIDAKGNVTPCVLLKSAVGNITNQRFKVIWREFLLHCSHPVRECVIEELNEALLESPIVPMPKAATLDSWSRVANTEPSDPFKRFNVTHRRDDHYSLAYLRGKYNLALQEDVDFEFKRNHWLPNLLGPPYIAFRSTLYGKEGHSEVPLHEYLHLAQFDKFGARRVLQHYLVHITGALREGTSFKDAFASVPFEVEARAFEKYPVQLADSRRNVA